MYYSMSWEIKAQTELLVRIVAFLPFCKRQISEGNHIWEGSPLPLLIDRIKRFCRLKESPGIMIDAELCISLGSFVGLKSSCLLENGIHIALRGPAFWPLGRWRWGWVNVILSLWWRADSPLCSYCSWMHYFLENGYRYSVSNMFLSSQM